MADLVGIFAVSHTPVLTNFPDAPGAAVRDAVYQAFTDFGAELAATHPDVLLLVSDDHMHNFFLDNLPAFCIGLGDGFDSPIEGWLKAAPRHVPGHPQLAQHLVEALFDAGFDPSVSMDLRLDHSMVTPLECAGIAGAFPVVPLFVNCVQPPMPRMRRCIALGEAIGAAIKALPGPLRIGVVGTGGISHDVGTPRMGIVNADFDREFLRLLGEGEPDALARYAQDFVHTGGNGTEEIRNWLIPHGVAGCAGFELMHYTPVPEWYTGIGLARWRLA